MTTGGRSDIYEVVITETTSWWFLMFHSLPDGINISAGYLD